MIVKVTRKSPFSGKTNTINIDVTQAQLDAYEGGAFVQNAFPHLTADEREFIMTGITPDEFPSGD